MQRDLVLRAQGGDHEAFTTLVDASIDRLYAAARLILHDDDRARDVVQDALLRAWTALPGLRDPERFEAWLHRLLVHACYRAAREARGRRQVEIHVAPLDGAAAPDGERALMLRDQLERGFRRLTPEQRAVLVLRYYLDFTDATAAEVLGLPIGTLKSRLNRASQALRAAVQADERASGLATESMA